MFSTHKNRNFNVLKAFLYFSILLVIASCVPQRKLIYLQDKGNKDTVKQKEFIRTEIGEEVIQPGDELYIRVSSSEERTTSFTERDVSSSDVELLSYTVDEQGYIRFPSIGETKLINLTLQEASQYMENLLSQFILRPSVNIKFVNKNITILGEINNPGVFTFYDKNLTVLQAIGYANDITTFGDRKNVLIIRESNGIIKKNYIDLTESDIFTSDLYIIKSNDIIYVEPLRRKKWGMETYPYGLLFSMISMTLMVISFLRYPVY